MISNQNGQINYNKSENSEEFQNQSLLLNQKEETQALNEFQMDNKSEASVFQTRQFSNRKDTEIILLDDDESFIDLNISKMYRGPLTQNFKRE